VLASDEFTDTRGNSAGPSMVANEVAVKLNVKAAVTAMNMTERRTNALLQNNGKWMLTTYSLVEIHFPGKGTANEKCFRGVAAILIE